MKFYDLTVKCDLADELGFRTCYHVLTGSNPTQGSNFIIAGNSDNVAQAGDYYFLKLLLLLLLLLNIGIKDLKDSEEDQLKHFYQQSPFFRIMSHEGNRAGFVFCKCPFHCGLGT
jgi:hypothetical protein